MKNNSCSLCKQQIRTQVPFAIFLATCMVAFGVALAQNSLQLALFWGFGIAFGYVLQRARFCFAAAFRDPFLLGITPLTRAVLLAIALTSIGFWLLHFLPAQAGAALAPSIDTANPIGLPLLLGGILFGVGMVIAGGCASGTLMRIGEGFYIQMLVLLLFVLGSVYGTHSMFCWGNALNQSALVVFLPDVFGWVGALLVQLACICLLYLAAARWQQKQTGLPAECSLGSFKSKCTQLRNMFSLRTLFTRQTRHCCYQVLVIDPFPYTVGAVLLAALQIAHFILLGNAWHITSTFTRWGIWLLTLVNYPISHWSFLASAQEQRILSDGFFADTGTMQNLGIIFGSLFATLLASQFKTKKIKSKKQACAAMIGGFLMGYGARLADGCNIGALFSAAASFSLSGWVFGACLLLGAFLGGKLLVRFLM